MSRQGGQGYSWDESLTWDEAENACLERGGHLASVLSAEERKSLGDGEHTHDSFLGGKRLNGTWTWSDGSPFNESGKIFILEEKPGDCLKHSTASIHTTDCSTILHYYWCKLETTQLVSQTNLTFKFSKTDLMGEMPWLVVDHQLLDENGLEKDTPNSLKPCGFFVEWSIEGGIKDNQLTTGSSSGVIQVGEDMEVFRGSSKLVFNIKIDTRSWGWNDALLVNITLNDYNDKMKTNIEQYILQPKMIKSSARSIYGSKSFPWIEAEEECSRKGGHLPSIHTLDDLEAIGSVIGSYSNGFWLGAQRTSFGSWTWSDGSSWDFENWDREDPNIKYGQQGSTFNCSMIWDDGTWWDWPCPNDRIARFACQIPPWAPALDLTSKVAGNAINLTFSKKTLQRSSLHISLNFEEGNQHNHKNQTFPGFQMAWQTNKTAQKKMPKPSFDRWESVIGVPEHKTIYLPMVVDMVADALRANISSEDLIQGAISFKKQQVVDGNISFDWCSKDEIKCLNKFQLVFGYKHWMNMSSDSVTTR